VLRWRTRATSVSAWGSAMRLPLLLCVVVHVPPDLVPQVGSPLCFGSEEVVERLEELGVRLVVIFRYVLNTAGHILFTVHIMHNVIVILLKALVDERQDPDW
jgi:hypothetical protein